MQKVASGAIAHIHLQIERSGSWDPEDQSGSPPAGLTWPRMPAPPVFARGAPENGRGKN